jgi:hypothetical protein
MSAFEFNIKHTLCNSLLLESSRDKTKSNIKAAPDNQPVRVLYAWKYPGVL